MELASIIQHVFIAFLLYVGYGVGRIQLSACSSGASNAGLEEGTQIKAMHTVDSVIG